VLRVGDNLARVGDKAMRVGDKLPKVGDNPVQHMPGIPMHIVNARVVHFVQINKTTITRKGMNVWMK